MANRLFGMIGLLTAGSLLLVGTLYVFEATYADEWYTYKKPPVEAPMPALE